ncbi:MAG: hypothetical protein JXR75_13675 [Rhodobacteraceae bacterium]|nr:hypothetical protein [Paracoccaceae bacterium]
MTTQATFTPDPSPDLEAAVLRARIMAAMAGEVALRRPYWIGGIPDALDLHATRKAVARLLKIDPETVAAILAEPAIQPKE